MLDASDTAALASALPPEYQAESDLHVTLAYLGKAADLTPQQRSDIDAALARVAGKFGPITGTVSGMGLFNQDEAGQRVLYASYDAPELPAFRQAIMEALTAVGAPVDDTHGFTPHITLAYCPNEDQAIVPDLPVLNITFPCVVRMFGGDRSDSYFNSDMAKEYSPLTVIKQLDGSYRWVLTSSNSFEDRDKEIVSQRALEADVDRADTTKEYGPLLWWHVKGLEIGDCDFNMVHGRMLVESGTFRDWRYAVAVKERAAELGVSIGFEYPRDEPDGAGVFYNIRRYERSLLPRAFASNPFTSVSLVKESNMATQADKVKAFAEFMRVDEATGLKMLAAAELAEKAALDANARTKAKKDDEEKVPAEDRPNGTDAAADKPYPKDVAEDDADPKDDAEKKVMTKKEFDAALTAVVSELEKVKGELHILQTAQAEKATRDARDAGELQDVKQLAETAQNGVLELKGELPRKLGDPLAAYRPSLHGKTPTEEKVKQAAPHEDPWAKHMNALLPTNTLVPPGN